jgi:hypothetical protein
MRLSFEADPAAVHKGNHRIVERIGELLQPATRAGRSRVQPGRALSLLTPGVAARGCTRRETHRSGPAVAARWQPRVWSFFFQRQMHPLVWGRLLRMARRDPLNVNTEPEPLDRESAEAIERGAGAARVVLLSLFCKASSPATNVFFEQTAYSSLDAR